MKSNRTHLHVMTWIVIGVIAVMGMTAPFWWQRLTALTASIPILAIYARAIGQLAAQDRFADFLKLFASGGNVPPRLVPYIDPVRGSNRTGQVVYQFVTGDLPMATAASFESALASIDWTNPAPAIDAMIEAAIASKFPNSANLQPEADAAIAGAVGLAQKLILVYAIAKVTPMLTAELTKISNAVPAVAPLIADLQAKLAALATTA